MDVESIFKNEGFLVNNPKWSKSKKNKEPRNIVLPVSSGNSLSDAVLKSSIEQFSTDYESNKQYLAMGLTPSQNSDSITLQNQAAILQSTADKWKNALGQALYGEGVLGSIEGFFNISDMISQGIMRTFTDTKDTDYNNPISKFFNKVQEDYKNSHPIFTENGVTITNGGLGNMGWWASNFPSMFTTLSLMIPGWGYMKGASLIGKYGKLGGNTARLIRNAARIEDDVTDINKLNKVQKIADRTARAIEAPSAAAKSWSKIIGMAAFQRLGENYQEAQQVYADIYNQGEIKDAIMNLPNDEYKEYLDSHQDIIEGDNEGDRQKDYNELLNNREETLRRIATKAADSDFNLNLLNFFSDVLQMYSLRNMWTGFRSGQGSFRLDKALLKAKQTAGMSSKEAAEFLANKSILTKGKENLYLLAKRGKYVGLAELSEGGEEIVNYIAQMEGMNVGRTMVGLEPKTNFDNRLSNYIKDGQLWDSAFWGWMGGIGFQGLGSAAGLASNRIKNFREKSKKENEFDKETGERTNKTKADIFKDFKDWESSEISARRKDIESWNAHFNILKTRLAKIANRENPFAKSKASKTLNTEEEVELARKKAIDDFLMERVIQSGHLGNIDLLKEYLKSNEVKKALVDGGVVKQEDADALQDLASSKVNQIGDSYKRELREVTNLARQSGVEKRSKNRIPLAWTQMIAAQNVRAKARLDGLDEQIVVSKKMISEAFADENIQNLLRNTSNPVTIEDMELAGKYVPLVTYMISLREQERKLRAANPRGDYSLSERASLQALQNRIDAINNEFSSDELRYIYMLSLAHKIKNGTLVKNDNAVDASIYNELDRILRGKNLANEDISDKEIEEALNNFVDKYTLNKKLKDTSYSSIKEGYNTIKERDQKVQRFIEEVKGLNTESEFKLGDLLGTYGYLSTEQIIGKSEYAGTRQRVLDELTLLDLSTQEARAKVVTDAGNIATKLAKKYDRDLVNISEAINNMNNEDRFNDITKNLSDAERAELREVGQRLNVSSLFGRHITGQLIFDINNIYRAKARGAVFEEEETAPDADPDNETSSEETTAEDTNSSSSEASSNTTEGNTNTDTELSGESNVDTSDRNNSSTGESQPTTNRNGQVILPKFKVGDVIEPVSSAKNTFPFTEAKVTKIISDDSGNFSQYEISLTNPMTGIIETRTVKGDLQEVMQVKSKASAEEDIRTNVFEKGQRISTVNHNNYGIVKNIYKNTSNEWLYEIQTEDGSVVTVEENNLSRNWQEVLKGQPKTKLDYAKNRIAKACYDTLHQNPDANIADILDEVIGDMAANHTEFNLLELNKLMKEAVNLYNHAMIMIDSAKAAETLTNTNDDDVIPFATIANITLMQAEASENGLESVFDDLQNYMKQFIESYAKKIGAKKYNGRYYVDYTELMKYIKNLTNNELTLDMTLQMINQYIITDPSEVKEISGENIDEVLERVLANEERLKAIEFAEDNSRSVDYGDTLDAVYAIATGEDSVLDREASDKERKSLKKGDKLDVMTVPTKNGRTHVLLLHNNIPIGVMAGSNINANNGNHIFDLDGIRYEIDPSGAVATNGISDYLSNLMIGTDKKYEDFRQMFIPYIYESNTWDNTTRKQKVKEILASEAFREGVSNKLLKDRAINGLVKLFQYNMLFINNTSLNQYVSDNIQGWIEHLLDSDEKTDDYIQSGIKQLSVDYVTSGELIRTAEYAKNPETGQVDSSYKQPIQIAITDAEAPSLAVHNGNSFVNISGNVNGVQYSGGSRGNRFIAITDKSRVIHLVPADPVAASGSDEFKTKENNTEKVSIGSSAQQIISTIKEQILDRSDHLFDSKDVSDTKAAMEEFIDFLDNIIGYNGYSIYSQRFGSKIKLAHNANKTAHYINMPDGKVYTLFSTSKNGGIATKILIKKDGTETQLDISKKENRDSFINDVISAINNNATFNISNQLIEADNDRFIDKNSFFNWDGEKFIIELKNRKGETVLSQNYDSFSNFIIDNNLIKVDLASENGSNYRDKSQTGDYRNNFQLRVTPSPEIIEQRKEELRQEKEQKLKEEKEKQARMQNAEQIQISSILADKAIKNKSLAIIEELYESKLGNNKALDDLFRFFKIKSKIKNIFPKNIEINEDKLQQTVKDNNYDENTNPYAAYYGDTDTVVVGDKFLELLNSNDENDLKEALRILLHESLHKSIDRLEHGSEKKQQMREIFEEFKKAINEDIKSLEEGKLEDIFARRKGLRGQNTEEYLRNVATAKFEEIGEDSALEEFFVESLTNNGLAQYLNSIHVESENKSNKKSLWQRIMEFLDEVLGLHIEKDSLREKEFNLLSDIIDNVGKTENTDQTKIIDNSESNEENVGENNNDDIDNENETFEENENELTDETEFENIENDDISDAGEDDAWDVDLSTMQNIPIISSYSMKKQLPLSQRAVFDEQINKGVIGLVCR